MLPRLEDFDSRQKRVDRCLPWCEGTQKRGRRPRWLRMELYRRVLELRRQGLSYKQIQRRIFEEASEWLSKSIISYWINRVHTPYGDGAGRNGEDRRTHKLRKCPELAYVIGATLGDGYINLEKERYNYLIILSVKDYDFAETFGKCAAVAVGRAEPYKPHWDKHLQRWKVKVYSKELYNLLKESMDIEEIRFYVEHPRECMPYFIRGFADAEGAVDKDEAHLGHIKITNSNYAIINYIRGLLERLGIYSKIYKRREKKYLIIRGKRWRRRKRVLWSLRIQRKADILRFRELIGFAIQRKQKILEMVK